MSLPKSVNIERVESIVSDSGNSPIILVDVREPSETAAGIIGKAQCVPLNTLGDFLKGPQSWPKDTPLVFYCLRGGRAQKAANMAIEHSYSEYV